MNMKYNLKHLLIAGFVALGLSSCDGFLNVMPSDALTTENAINNIGTDKNFRNVFFEHICC